MKRGRSIVITLVDIYSRWDTFIAPLYALLAERAPEQSISHSRMPSMAEHTRFVESRPYKCWYEILADGKSVGSIYLTKRHEIGVSIFRHQQRKGYGSAAVRELMLRHNGPFLANINPKNDASIRMWESLNFKLLQVTYAS